MNIKKNRKTCTCLTFNVIYIVDLTGIVHRVGKPVQFAGSRRYGKGPKPHCVAYVVFVGSIIIRRLYKLTLYRPVLLSGNIQL
jgi:hypothetical protein